MFFRSFRICWLLPITLALVWAAGIGPARAQPAPAPVQPMMSADEIRADFVQLYATLRQAHFNLYARVSKADYDRLYARTLADIREPASRSDVAVRFQRFVAFGKVAHARIDANYHAFAQYMAGGGKAFPLYIRVVDGKTFVTENRGGAAGLALGDQIIALNGRPIDAWLDLGGRNLSADTPYMAHALMELDLPMLLWLELGSVDSFDLTLRRCDGAVVRLALPARTKAQMTMAAKAQPPALDRDANARVARMLDGKIAYLQPGPFYDDAPDAVNAFDNAAFRRFIDGAFQSFVDAGAQSLIIDLRDNPGGDSSFSDLMVRWFADRPFKFNSAFKIKVSEPAIAANAKRLALGDESGVSAKFAAAYARAKPGDIIAFDDPATDPKPEPRFKGRVYALINRNSYSNTVAVAASIQDYRLGVVIGEETSDLATTFGAMETFELSHSGLTVGFPKANIIRPNGDLTPRGVVPDIPIETPVVEGPDDPVLKDAIAIAARGR